MQTNSNSGSTGNIDEVVDDFKGASCDYCGLGSRVYISFNKSRSPGLGDVAFQFRGWANLAVWLGATLHAPKPSTVLRGKHNYHHEIAGNATWDDYLQVMTLRTKKPFPVHRDDEPTLGGGANCVHISTKTKATFLEDLHRAYRQTRLLNCVLWTVNAGYYTVAANPAFGARLLPRNPESITWFTANALALHPPIFSNCPETAEGLLGAFIRNGTVADLVNVTTTPAAQRIAHDVIGNRTPYTSLHVRRGDVKRPHRCLTPVARVVEYSNFVPPRTPYLMVLTDEDDPVYLQKLKVELQKTWQHVDFLDKVIQQHLPATADNYRVYAVASTIIGNAAFQMATPKKCDNHDPLPQIFYNICHPCGSQVASPIYSCKN